jgi:Short C-terminal domain
VPLMRRRPLLRAAAVGGGAYYAGKRRAENEEREAEQEARLGGLERDSMAAPEPASGGLSADAMEQLKSLAQLRDQGILTDQEFDQQKARLLGG